MRASRAFILAAIGLPGAAAAQVTNPLNCHTYLLTPSPMTWTDAEAFAVSLGGHLATVRSAAEHDWIMRTFFSGPNGRRIAWIGLNDAALEGTFVWASGEPATFLNWSPTEPNNNSGCPSPDEDYTALNWHHAYGYFPTPGQWNDAPDQGVSRPWPNGPLTCRDPYLGLVEVAAPLIVTPPAGRRLACPGQVMELTVAATGTGPFQFRWRRGGVPLSDGPTGTGSTISGAETAALRLDHVSTADTGEYDCLVSNACGAVDSADATLTVVDCYADCDCASAPGTLDIFDFLCFQNRFDAGDPYACDCDTGGGPGACDIFDFLCFQNAFAAGCP